MALSCFASDRTSRRFGLLLLATVNYSIASGAHARQRVNISQYVHIQTDTKSRPRRRAGIKQSPARSDKTFFSQLLGGAANFWPPNFIKQFNFVAISTLTLLWNIKLDLLLRLPHCPRSFLGADPISKCDTVYDALNCDASGECFLVSLDFYAASTQRWYFFVIIQTDFAAQLILLIII